MSHRNALHTDPRLAIAIVLAALASLAAGILLTTASAHDASAAEPQATASAVSYKKARAILLDKVIKPSSLADGDAVIAFTRKHPLNKNTRVAPYRKRGKSVRLKRKAWFFWVDDEPKAQFEHNTRYVFIDAETGDVRVVKNKWWPTINGKTPWFASSKYWNKKNWVYSNVTPPAGASTTSARVARALPQARVAASTTECAVLIAGSNDAKAGFLDDVDGMETALTGLGFTTTKIKPPAKNGKAEFEAAVDALVKDGCKNVLLYIASHGSKESVDMGKGTYTPKDMAALMDKHKGIGFKVVIQACKSGTWVNPLKDKAQIIETSTDSTKDSFSADPDGKDDPNPGDKGSEFTSGLIEDLNALHTDPASTLRWQQCILGNPTGGIPPRPPLVCALEIAYESALAKDEDAKGGKAAPQKHP